MSNYIIISLIAIVSNIPLGYWRGSVKKFSFLWFFYIHASIPLLIYLRISLHTSSLYIPVTIALAILGQFMGLRVYKKTRIESHNSSNQ